MKIITNKIILIIGCLLILSCNDFLNVQKDSSLVEGELFSKVKGIEKALNGIYISMASETLYGGNLTMSFIEVLGQRFDTKNKSNAYHLIGKSKYGDGVKKIEQLWSNMYTTILEINNFLKRLKKDTKVLSSKHQKILEGEAYGLRAMLHFDLLRLFGPVYVTNPEALSIPYRYKGSYDKQKRLPASAVIKKILSDLATAENLLKEDPIRKYGKIASSSENIVNLKNSDPIRDYNDSDFYRFRNLRMNYYAVKALQARVNLYAGNKQQALTAAKVVIDEGGKWFPWTDEDDVVSSGTPDRLFSKELIFSLPNPKILREYKMLYAPTLPDASILTTNPARLNDVYENNKNDYRLKSCWERGAKKKAFIKIFIKFRQKDILTKEQQPLIRLSEMYYIAAETESNPANALTYLNTVLTHRGVAKIGTTNNLKGEIVKEYRKEFYGEGQLFFYYKRLNYGVIPNGSSTDSSNSFYRMDDRSYVIPVPPSENLQ